MKLTVYLNDDLGEQYQRIRRLHPVAQLCVPPIEEAVSKINNALLDLNRSSSPSRADFSWTGATLIITVGCPEDLPNPLRERLNSLLTTHEKLMIHTNQAFFAVPYRGYQETKLALAKYPPNRPSYWPLTENDPDYSFTPTDEPLSELDLQAESLAYELMGRVSWVVKNTANPLAVLAQLNSIQNEQNTKTEIDWNQVITDLIHTVQASPHHLPMDFAVGLLASTEPSLAGIQTVFRTLTTLRLRDTPPAEIKQLVTSLEITLANSVGLNRQYPARILELLLETGPALVILTPEEFRTVIAHKNLGDKPLYIYNPTGEVGDIAGTRGYKTMAFSPLSLGGEPPPSQDLGPKPSWAACQQVASYVVEDYTYRPGVDWEYWSAAARNLIGPLFYAALKCNADLSEVTAWINHENVQTPLAVLRYLDPLASFNNGETPETAAETIAIHQAQRLLTEFENRPDKERGTIFSLAQMIFRTLTESAVKDSTNTTTFTPDINDFLSNQGIVYLVLPNQEPSRMSWLFRTLIFGFLDQLTLPSNFSPDQPSLSIHLHPNLDLQTSPAFRTRLNDLAARDLISVFPGSPPTS